MLQSGENDFMKPTNSLDKGGASGGVTSVSGGSATSGNREGGGSGPPQATSGNGHNLNGSASLTPHLGLPSTNGECVLICVGHNTWTLLACIERHLHPHVSVT